MENLVLVVHLILALCLIAVVLLQRSEGGALGMGGGGGGMVSARGAASALSKVTWLLAIGFICTSITLTVISGGRQDSVFDTPAAGDLETPLIPSGAVGSGGAQDDDVPLPVVPDNN
ncbi:MAG: preprotein translocase subunit SecG [Paracoccaceae bacterium]